MADIRKGSESSRLLELQERYRNLETAFHGLRSSLTFYQPEYNRLKTEIARLREVLAKYEWVDARCLSCLSRVESGHMKDCLIARALLSEQAKPCEHEIVDRKPNWTNGVCRLCGASVNFDGTSLSEQPKSCATCGREG